ncbi:hypothetical protein BO71DRAFT_437237 [Aspergillus ellipticus CBS 707.79]|uniref:Copper-fist domain-containing protein n=1 Tax=Aspergillus ellipticus CBS 707.79 TaxID=1448320 RepID=A0A319DPR7_9EURO|nr:hypothetical protein BO71DRAFT_437237 [Aspergillus ellipticus CBS 707.79]
MPLDEEGAKWSCEPCIRGHRSSKCQHFDRMMIKVPKAGRPLARCPHPKGSCSCQKLYAFMIRIPKGSTCLCRPMYHVSPETAESAPAPTTPTPSSTPNKIQKPVKRQIKTAPENLTKALSSIPEFGKQHAESEMNGMPTRSYSYPTQEHGLNASHDVLNGEPKKLVTTSRQVSDQNGEGTIPQGSSCCSRKPQPPTQTPAPQAQRSCCEAPKSLPDNVNNGTILGSSDYFHAQKFKDNDTSHSSNSIPSISTWQDFQATRQSHYMQPFSLPFSQPELPPMPGHMTHIEPNSVEFSYPQPLNGHARFQPSIPQQHSDSTQIAFPKTEETGCDATHDCSCGDGCQCLGCASHPFNNTTRQHVQEMGRLVTLNDDEQKTEGLNSHRNSPLQGQHSIVTQLPYQYTNFAHPVDHGVQPIGMHSYVEQSPTLGNVNSGYTSPPADYILDQHLMVPSEYHTLEYPVGLPSACADTTGNCQCGNDCTCVGCLTHSGHTGLGLEPTMETSWSHMDFPHFPTDATGINTSQMPVFDDFVSTNSML